MKHLTDFTKPCRASNIYYRFWYLRRRIRKLLPCYIS